MSQEYRDNLAETMSEKNERLRQEIIELNRKPNTKETYKTVSFDLWMFIIDTVMNINLGFMSGDLADQTWRDWYEDGFTVKEAVQECLQNVAGEILGD